ncbi:DUF6359 domain-containing protein [Bacteroides faecichinchillae]|uniref:DUF6359 domain-containing protein n=1 Tax=Bacteroides faecichinchillae TaxID=871325 RepID=UPI0035141795
MKKILNALFLTLLAVITFSGCSDVPAPYDIKEGGDDSELVGDGSKNNPYDVTSYLIKKSGTDIWVEGYIVGCMNNKYDGVDASGEPVFAGNEFVTSNFNVNTNIVIAATTSETSTAKIIAVKLPAGDLRDKLNVKDNNGNLGMSVKIKGNYASKYCGVTGLIDITAAVLHTSTGDVEIGDGSSEGPTDAYINESFKSSLGGFTSVSVSGTLSWINDYSSAMIKGGSAEGKFPSETWLVAPTINLSQETEAYITFKHAINYADAATIKDYHQLMISKDYTGNVSQATWTNLPIVMASGNSFTFVSSGNVGIPAEFIGQSSVTIALKYTSTEMTGSTWEVQNFVVAHGKGEEIVDPEPPVTDNSKDNPYDVTKALTLTSTNGTAIAWVKGYIVGGVKNGNDANTVDAPEDVVFGLDDIRNSAILIAASKEETDYTKCMVIGFGKDSPTAKPALNLVDNPDNLGKEVVILGTLKYAFGAPGMKTITDFEFLEGGSDPEPTGPVYTSNITLPAKDWSNSSDAAYGGIVKIGTEETEYPIVKLGTTKLAGVWSSPVLGAAKTKLAFYAVGWKGKSGILKVTIENGGTFEGGEATKQIDLAGNIGATSNSPFTITPADSDYYEFTLTGITATSTIKFNTAEEAADKRAIIFGINVN